MIEKTHIKSILFTQKPKLQRQYPINRIGLFGSFVRGEQTTNSDVDLIVEFKKDINLFKFIHLRDDLSSLLQNIPVDLVTKKAIKKQLINQILNEVEWV